MVTLDEAHMATIGDPGLSTIQESGQHNSFVDIDFNVFLQTYFKSEELSSFCEARYYSLHGRLSMSNKGSIISEQKLPDQFLLALRVG